MTQTPTEHEAQVLRLLSMFQTLELSLKFYIAAAYKRVKDALDGSLPFKYGYKDVENYPLERLLGVFAKLNDDAVLQSRMNKLVPKRNLVAHRALAYRHEVIADLLEIDRDALLVDLKLVEIELNECLKTLGATVAVMLQIDDGSNTAA
jgi:hypothetical protein